MSLSLTLILVGNLVVTSYRSIPEATDSTPFITSIGERTNPSGIAVSQDLLKSGKVKYGDWVYVEHIGLKRVNDTMHPRWTNRADVWVATYKEEKAFDEKFRGRKLRMYLVKEKHK